MLILEQVIMEEGFTKRFWMTGILRFLPIADSHQTNPLQIVVCLTLLRKAETCNKDPKYLRSLKLTTEPTQGPNQDPVTSKCLPSSHSTCYSVTITLTCHKN